jgi:Concanavalin A-like lectin/glucanases superfamily/PEP-CTERM motif
MNGIRVRIRATTLMVLLAFFAIGPSESKAASLTAYYPFDGNGNDASGNGYNLTLYGGVGFASGLFGQALNPNGDDAQYAARPVSDSAFDFGSNNFTVSIWVNFNSTSGEQTMIEKWTGAGGPGWTLTKPSDNSLRFATSFDGSGILNSAPLTITAGVWNDIVVRRDGSSWTLDYDGQVVATATSAATIASSSNPLLIGRRDAGDGRDFSVNGRIDEAAIWNGALSDANVSTLWNGGTGTPANQILTSVPEPSSVVLLSLGLIGVAVRARRRVVKNRTQQGAKS